MVTGKTVHLVTIIFLLAQSCLAYIGPSPKNFDIKAGAVKLDRHWQLTFDHDYMVGGHGEDLYYTHSDMGLVCKGLADWLEFGINYSQVYLRSDAEPYKAADRPHMNVTLRGQILALDISNGSRFEYQGRQDQKSFWRYRNRFAVKLPSLVSAFKLQPYLAHDFFTDLSETSDFARNGFSSGASLRLSRNLTGDFYYRWQTSRYDGVWYDYKIIGTSLRFTF